MSEAYRLGFRDGVAATKELVARAEIQPEPQPRPNHQERKPAAGPPAFLQPSRIRPLARRILTERPGLPLFEVANAVVSADPALRKSSVRNELVRQQGKFYRRDGMRWYALPSAGDTDMAA